MAGSFDEKSILEQTLSLPEAERSAFLREVCPDEQTLDRMRMMIRQRIAGETSTVGGQQDDQEAESAPKQIDEFKILHRLGEGGMGTVYLAEDTILGRKVALKVLSQHLIANPKAVERFREEARSAAQLTHPAIVPVFKLGSTAGKDYIVSEFIDGPTLREEIAGRHELRTDDRRNIKDWIAHTVEVVATIADALECAHRMGIVHRDVKPSNILMDRQRGPRLTDFGIAKHFTDPNAAETAPIGSCHYMSPEQARLKDIKIDQRSDIFSLGVVLYEMLTLRRPFEGSTVHEVLFSLGTKQPARVRSVNPQVPVDLETICLKAMEKLPDDRYQLATQLSADLRCYTLGKPILAQPPSLVRRAKRWVSAHRLLVGVSTCLLLALTALALGLKVRAMRNEAFAFLAVETELATAKVRAYRLDAKSMEFPATPTWTSQAPLTRKLIDPGDYRIVVSNTDDSAFAEFGVSLFPGAANKTTLWAPAMPSGIKARLATARDDASQGRVLAGAITTLTEADLAEMVLINAGTFEVGWAEAEEDVLIAKHNVTLPAFYIDRYEVSNAEYRQFVDATGHPQPYIWSRFGYDETLADRPVIAVTVEDAEAYARWRGKRLPTHFEWEAAMRQPHGWKLPWSGDPPETLPEVTVESIILSNRTELEIRYQEYKVRTFGTRSRPEFSTSLGIHHAATNVREWTVSVSHSKPGIAIARGATWVDVPQNFDLSSNLTWPAESPSMHCGFRCARSAHP